MKTKLLSLFICLQISIFAQTNGMHVPGMGCKACPRNPHVASRAANTTTAPLTATLVTNYTMSACGLNYVTASRALFQRSINPYPINPVQPVTYSISGIPPCATVLKAFLYAGVLGSGTTIATATVTNPSTVTTSFPMTLVGGDADLCWGYAGSFTYRADVTSAIAGNGNYMISGIPTATNLVDDDAEGAVLIIVYADPSQNYTGNIVIADGCQINFPNACSSHITGFNVCGTPTLTTHFMTLSDMQGGGDIELSLNATAPNYTVLAANQNIWDFVSGPAAPATVGQNSADYGIVSTGDCVGIMMAGMYYRSGCFTCTATSGLSVTAVGSASVCPGTATASTIGGSGAYTYTWSGSASTQSTSIATGLGNGTYTVNVTSQSGCTGVGVVTVSALAPTISVTQPSLICKGSKVKLVAGPAASYSWTPSTFLNVTNSATVLVTPTTTATSITYTVDYTNASGCSNKAVTTLTISKCTSIEEVANEEFQLLIYPNPNSGNFTVESKAPVNLILVNTMGQIIRSVELNPKNNNRISLTGISEGVYYFVSRDKSQSIKQKIVVGK